MTEDEEFFAWIDGELDSERAARVEARVGASPELSAKAAEHRRLSTTLQQAFAPIVEAEAQPPRFGGAQLVELGSMAAGHPRRRASFGLPQWAAMAATLAVGLVVGNMLGNGSSSLSPVAVESGRLVASASLEQALDEGLAGSPANSGPRIGLTFRDANGGICRSFADGTASGLACRDGRHWRIDGLFQGAEGQSSDYRMASGPDPRLAGLIDEKISGEPFDAEQERAAMEAGWR